MSVQNSGSKAVGQDESPPLHLADSTKSKVDTASLCNCLLREQRISSGKPWHASATGLSQGQPEWSQKLMGSSWQANAMSKRVEASMIVPRLQMQGFKLETDPCLTRALHVPDETTNVPLGANCECHGHLHVRFYLGRSHVGSNDSNYKITKVSVDVHRGEHP